MDPNRHFHELSDMRGPVWALFGPVMHYGWYFCYGTPAISNLTHDLSRFWTAVRAPELVGDF